MWDRQFQQNGENWSGSLSNTRVLCLTMHGSHYTVSFSLACVASVSSKGKASFRFSGHGRTGQIQSK